MIVPQLANLAARKLREAQERTKDAMAKAADLLEVAAGWHTKENAPEESQQAARDIAAAGNLCDRGTFLGYIEAERLARSGMGAAKQAIVRQQSALTGRLKSGLNELTQLLEGVRPLAKKYAKEKLGQAERGWEEINRQPSSYDDFMLALKRLDQVKRLLGQVAAEGEENYSKKRALGAGMGGVVGAMVVGAVGFFAGAVVAAVIGLVVCIPLCIIEAVSGHKGLADHIFNWICGICGGVGVTLGAIIGAVGGGSTVMKWIKRR